MIMQIELQNFWNKKFGIYQYLHVKSDVLLVFDIFDSLRSSFIEIYKFDSAHAFFSTSIFIPSTPKKCKIKIKTAN